MPDPTFVGAPVELLNIRSTVCVPGNTHFTQLVLVKAVVPAPATMRFCVQEMPSIIMEAITSSPALDGPHTARLEFTAWSFVFVNE